MPGVLDFLPLLAMQQLARRQQPRTPEPDLVTADNDHVVQYDQVMSTKLVLAYALAFEIIHRARSEPRPGSTTIDLACGPGHYTLALARFLGYDQVEGLDLASAMIETATANAAATGLGDRVRFRLADVTQLDGIESGSVDLANFADAAHHMPDLPTVSRVLVEMDRITRPDGLVMVMDLVRLRTARLTERYVGLLGADYVERGLPQFLLDFRNSMYAAWTPKELRQAIPRNSRRHWRHLVPRGLPSVQIILGLPVGRTRTFVRSGVPWTPADNPVPPAMRAEWNILRNTVRFGSQGRHSPTTDHLNGKMTKHAGA